MAKLTKKSLKETIAPHIKAIHRAVNAFYALRREELL